MFFFSDVYFEVRVTEVWGEVRNNVGDGYNVTTGKFVAPLRGVYRITVSVMNDGNNDRAITQIIHNENALCSAMAAGHGDKNQFGMCSQVVCLAAGDEVWVVNPQWSSTVQYYRGYTTFQGFLLHGEP